MCGSASFSSTSSTGELSGRGTRVLLQMQSFELLKALLERPGQMVSREELRQRLWPGDTFVDFEHGLNAAVRRLREVLGDTADNPRFVETIPRRGYRLVAPTDVPAPMPSRFRSRSRSCGRRPCRMARRMLRSSTRTRGEAGRRQSRP